MPRSRRECRNRAAISPRSCRDLRRHYHLAETAEIASRLPRSRQDRAKIYGDCNISPRMLRSRRNIAEILQRFYKKTLSSRRDCRDRAVAEIVQRFKKTLSSRRDYRDLAEIILRFMETVTSCRDCRLKSRRDLTEDVPRLKKTLTSR